MNGDLKKIAQSVIEDVISDRITLNDYKKAIEILAKALNEVLDLPSAELIVKTAKPTNNSNIQTIYTDGACSGNPGPGGYGVVVIRNEEPEVTYSEGYKLTTNNRMELMAAIYALGVDKDIAVEKTILSDSKYVTDAVNKGWLESWKKKNFHGVANSDLWKKFANLMQELSDKGCKVTFTWVKGHAGNAFNEKCDELAVKACKRPTLTDPGYESQNQ